MEKEIIQLSSVATYTEYCGLETVHPLVAVVDMSKATRSFSNARLNYGLYALWLKNGTSCSIRYGRRKYDYQEGTIVCFAPGQVVEIEKIDDTEGSPVGILFHPDLINGTSLGSKMDRYSFFSYYEAEALHLSKQERGQFLAILDDIESVTRLDAGEKSQAAICHRIENLLDLCLSFYERQFCTREQSEGDILADFEREIKAYYADGLARKYGFPTVAFISDRMHLSPGYFGTLIKRETGRTAHDCIRDAILNLAKHELLGSDLPIKEIAHKLGYSYSQHFNRMFKRETGVSPRTFRNKKR